MATIDRVVLRIEADLKDVNQKLSKFEKQVDSSTKKSTSGFQRIAGIAKVAIGAVVVQQIAKATLSLVQFSGNIDELRSKSAAVFKEFTSDVRAELSAFGDAVGRSTHELESMASSVQDTFVPLGFARGEAAKLSTNLTKLAVDVASFNNANDVETMEAFKSALVGNHEAVRRFGIVITETELKAELLRMGITKNSKDVDAATKVQARLNLIMQGTGDAQGDATRTAESFANTSRALRAELSELGDELGRTLVPTFTALARKAIDTTKAVRNLFLELGLATPRLDTVGEITDEIDRLTISIQAASFNLKKTTGLDNPMMFFGGSEAILALSLFNRKAVETIKINQERLRQLEFSKGILQQNNFYEKEAAKIRADDEKLKKFIDLRGKMAKENEKIVALSKEELGLQKFLRENMPKNIEMNKEQKEQITNLLTERFKQNQILEESNEKIKMATQFVDSLGTEQQELLKLEVALLEARNRGAITAEEYALATSKVKEEMEKLKGTTTEMSDLNQIFLDTTVQVAQGLEDAFISALDGSKSALESMRDITTQLIEEILRQFMRLTIINPIIQSIFGSVPGFQSSQFPIATPSQIFSGAKKTFLGKAGGGTVQGRKPIMVGERGPEMFVPNTGGRIVPNGALGSSVRGGGNTIVNQSLNFATGIQNTVRAEVMNMMPIIQNATLQAVVDQKRRGGSFGQGMS
tara:strand:+ start:2736 stop:4829 length:2094 start_codon:yes stop_codon:yes gene_type:complete